MFILGVIIVIFIGLLMLLNPYLVYEITEEWKNDGGGEPSKSYIWQTRISGIICLVVGIVCGLIKFFVN